MNSDNTSTTTPQQQKQNEEKISVKISDGSDIRRFSIVPTETNFDSLLEKIIFLFGTYNSKKDYKNATISYLDDESDTITISSNEELKEAISIVRASKQNTLRLRITLPNNNNNNHQQRNDTSSSPSSNNNSACEWKKLHHTILRLFNGGTIEDLKSAISLLQQQISLKPDHPVSHYNLACAKALFGALAGNGNGAEGDSFASAFAHLRNAIDLGYKNLKHLLNDKDLNALHNQQQFWDIVKELHQKFSSSQAGHNFDLKGAGRCPLRKNQQEFHALHKAAYKLLSGDEKDLQTAKVLLHQQIEMQPNNPIPYYNLACAECLLGDVESSFTHLQQAVVLGFKDSNHIKNDKDLLLLHDQGQFWELIVGLEKEKNSNSSSF